MRLRPLSIICSTLAVAGMSVWLAGCSPSPAPPPAPAASAPAAQAAAPAPVARMNVIAADLPPLPDGLFNAPREPEIVKAAYEFAARHPEVLKYVPCFCGCEHMGHKGNDDCFVSKRNAAGQVTEWESHGMVCELCIDIAVQAMQMHNSGASTQTIRDAVEQKYAALSESRHTHTPTPQPPKSKSKPGLLPH
jgi:hypothetical protein